MTITKADRERIETEKANCNSFAIINGIVDSYFAEFAIEQAERKNVEHPDWYKLTEASKLPSTDFVGLSTRLLTADEQATEQPRKRSPKGAKLTHSQRPAEGTKNTDATWRSLNRKRKESLLSSADVTQQAWVYALEHRMPVVSNLVRVIAWRAVRGQYRIRSFAKRQRISERQTRTLLQSEANRRSAESFAELLETLPVDLRPYAAKLAEGMSQREVAAKLGKTQAWVSKQFQRIRGLLCFDHEVANDTRPAYDGRRW